MRTHRETQFPSNSGLTLFLSGLGKRWLLARRLPKKIAEQWMGSEAYGDLINIRIVLARMQGESEMQHKEGLQALSEIYRHASKRYNSSLTVLRAVDEGTPHGRKKAAMLNHERRNVIFERLVMARVESVIQKARLQEMRDCVSRTEGQVLQGGPEEILSSMLDLYQQELTRLEEWTKVIGADVADFLEVIRSSEVLATGPVGQEMRETYADIKAALDGFILEDLALNQRTLDEIMQRIALRQREDQYQQRLKQHQELDELVKTGLQPIIPKLQALKPDLEAMRAELSDERHMLVYAQSYSTRPRDFALFNQHLEKAKRHAEAGIVRAAEAMKHRNELQDQVNVAKGLKGRQQQEIPFLDLLEAINVPERAGTIDQIQTQPADVSLARVEAFFRRIDSVISTIIRLLDKYDSLVLEHGRYLAPRTSLLVRLTHEKDLLDHEKTAIDLLRGKVPAPEQPL
jgi:hypothetical protein